MRKLFWAVALFWTIMGVTPVAADSGFSILIPNPANCIGTGIDCHATPVGYQQITTLTSATNLTVPASATFAVIQCTGQPVFWRDDGTAPTATIGMPLAVSTTMIYAGNLAKIQFIQTAASATCDISYYR